MVMDSLITNATDDFLSVLAVFLLHSEIPPLGREAQTL